MRHPMRVGKDGGAPPSNGFVTPSMLYVRTSTGSILTYVPTYHPKGQADQSPFDRAIDVKELERYLYRRVKELTKGDQTPTTATPQGVTPIPITLVR